MSSPRVYINNDTPAVGTLNKHERRALKANSLTKHALDCANHRCAKHGASGAERVSASSLPAQSDMVLLDIAVGIRHG